MAELARVESRIWNIFTLIARMNVSLINYFLAILLSILISMRRRCVISVTYDGQDWTHKWKSTYLVMHEPLFDPESYVSVHLELFCKFYELKTGDVVVDIGAGLGTEIISFRRIVGPTGQIFAIEADPSVFRRLEKTCSLNKYENVILTNKAAASKNGEILLKQVSEDGVSNHINWEFSPYDSDLVSVSAATLDQMILDWGISSIDLLKMNIEGGEIGALEGFENRHSLVRNWVVSCHDFIDSAYTKTFSWVNLWFIDRGYELLEYDRKSRSGYLDFYIFARRNNV